jgi:hypothetical protein
VPAAVLEKAARDNVKEKNFQPFDEFRNPVAIARASPSTLKSQRSRAILCNVQQRNKARNVNSGRPSWTSVNGTWNKRPNGMIKARIFSRRAGHNKLRKPIRLVATVIIAKGGEESPIAKAMGRVMPGTHRNQRCIPKGKFSLFEIDKVLSSRR